MLNRREHTHIIAEKNQELDGKVKTHMGKQYNKSEKRSRRERYLKRKKAAAKAPVPKKAAPKKAAPEPAAPAPAA